MNRVIADLPVSPKGQVPDMYDIKEVLTHTQSSMDPNIHAKFAQLLRTISDVLSESIGMLVGATLRCTGLIIIRYQNRLRYLIAEYPCILKQIYVRRSTYFEKHKLITACHTLYSSPAVLVSNKNGKLRLVIDYWQLSKQTVKSCWPNLCMEVIFDTLEGSCYFSSIEIS